MDERASFDPQAVIAPRQRRGIVAGVAIAVVIVGATIAAGLLGSRTPPAPPDRQLAAVAPSGATESLSNFHPSTLPRYPSSVLGLQVWAAAFLSKNATDPRTVVAVSGWYAARPAEGCPTLDAAPDPGLEDEFGIAASSEAFCDRSGELFTAPMYGENAAPIGIRLRPGVPGPSGLADAVMVVPVVFVGRLAEPGTPCPAQRGCGPVLVVDHVAWASGVGQPRASSVLPRLLDRWPPIGPDMRDDIVQVAIGDAGPVLLETLVDRATLERVDPHAAEMVGFAAPEADRIWYRLVLGAEPASDPQRWVTMDDDTQRVIASGQGRP